MFVGGLKGFNFFFRYRAILGPFQWGVWVCVIFIYLFAVVPVAFSHKLTCRMFEGCEEVGSMFWIVFGTFTNLFTFRGDRSWNNYKNSSTRTVIGKIFASQKFEIIQHVRKIHWIRRVHRQNSKFRKRREKLSGSGKNEISWIPPPSLKYNKWFYA